MDNTDETNYFLFDSHWRSSLQLVANQFILMQAIGSYVWDVRVLRERGGGYFALCTENYSTIEN
ncbi:hypothetical protein T4E_10748 [Trichinella pseudospiralis]|uniref:Uncharacterized protein n=1 Tax=Trichinella pseudospiralis TaxID=6337 RepID=A0A0V0XYX8_TRIPS|nr:hypothetical protein T4E_10748 [Trichinella pseudospiralis]